MARIELARGLTPSQLEAIADLERRVVAHDGGRLKLEWARLRSRSGDRAEDVLAWDGDELVGFTGLYGPGPPSIEIAGMVEPTHRRRGIGDELLGEALGLCARLGVGEPLVIVPRQSVAGRALAHRHGGRLEHSEHALALIGDPADGASDPALSLRTARREDIAALLRILTTGFGHAPADVAERLVEPTSRTLVAEHDGSVIATVRIEHGGDVTRVYGFAVDPALRGRGIGRDVLRRVCRRARADGARGVELEVEVDNERALHLYTSLGFEPVTTEDYWAVAATPRA